MIYVFILVLVFLLDYKIKSYVEVHKKEGQSEVVLGGFIKLRRMSNPGIACSLLENKPKMANWFSGIALLLMGISYLKMLFQKGSKGIKICYSLILGGGLSNFFDRIKKGAVTDYFSFCVPFKWLRRLVFNISDMFIVIGSSMAVLLQVKKENRRR